MGLGSVHGIELVYPTCKESKGRPHLIVIVPQPSLSRVLIVAQALCSRAGEVRKGGCMPKSCSSKTYLQAQNMQISGSTFDPLAKKALFPSINHPLAIFTFELIPQ